MPSKLVLNPLTYGRLVPRDEGTDVLQLRCHARGRSLGYINIDPRKQPDLFDALSAWLDGGPAKLPELEPLIELELCSQGLLITQREMTAIPEGLGPERGEGRRMAAALCPEAATFLEEGPCILQPPAGADTFLEQQGYCLVPPVISDQDLAALRAYYRMINRNGWLKLKDDESRRRSAHNDPMARLLHHRLTPFLAALAGRDIQPSFAYTGHYEDQTPLNRHLDRAQCEFTFSLLVEYNPEFAGDVCPWPLMIHTATGDVMLHQQYGGGVLFRGRALEHSRPPLPEGHTAQLIFLCYVLPDFADTLD